MEKAERVYWPTQYSTHCVSLASSLVSLMNPHNNFMLFSCKAISDSLQPQGLQNARLPCPSLSWNWLRLVHWVINAIQSLILCRPLLLLPSIFPSIRVFSNKLTLYQMAKVLELQLQHQSCQRILLFSPSVVSGCLWPHGLQHTRLSFTIFSSLLKLMPIELVMPSNHHSFISMNIQGWYPLGLTSLISLLSKGLSNLKASVPQFKSISSLVLNLLYDPALTSNWTGRWC